MTTFKEPPKLPFSLLPDDQYNDELEREGENQFSPASAEKPSTRIRTIIKFDPQTGKNISKQVIQLPPVGERNQHGYFIYYETNCPHSPDYPNPRHQKCLDNKVSTYQYPRAERLFSTN